MLVEQQGTSHDKNFMTKKLKINLPPLCVYCNLRWCVGELTPAQWGTVTDVTACVAPSPPLKLHTGPIIVTLGQQIASDAHRAALLHYCPSFLQPLILNGHLYRQQRKQWYKWLVYMSHYSNVRNAATSIYPEHPHVSHFTALVRGEKPPLLLWAGPLYPQRRYSECSANMPDVAVPGIKLFEWFVGISAERIQGRAANEPSSKYSQSRRRPLLGPWKGLVESQCCIINLC